LYYKENFGADFRIVQGQCSDKNKAIEAMISELKSIEPLALPELEEVSNELIFMQKCLMV